jgi:hypothetical protein
MEVQVCPGAAQSVKRMATQILRPMSGRLIRTRLAAVYITSNSICPQPLLSNSTRIFRYVHTCSYYPTDNHLEVPRRIALICRTLIGATLTILDGHVHAEEGGVALELLRQPRLGGQNIG